MNYCNTLIILFGMQKITNNVKYRHLFEEKDLKESGYETYKMARIIQMVQRRFEVEKIAKIIL